MSLVSVAVSLGEHTDLARQHPSIDEFVALAKPDSLKVSIKGTPEEIQSAIDDLSAKGVVVSATISLRLNPDAGV